MFILKRAHELELQIKRIEFEHFAQLHQQKSMLLIQEQDRNRSLTKAVEELTATNAKLTQELLILRNTARVPTVEDKSRATDHLYQQPDIVVSSDNGERRAAAQKEIADLEAELERQLADITKDVDISNVTPEALEEATVGSEEEWRKQHAGPQRDSLEAAEDS